MTSTVNLIASNDADYTRGFTYQTVSAVPINLTGSTFRMGVRKHASDVTEIILLSTENGGVTITDGVNGKFSITITQANLLKIEPGDYEHSLIRTKDGAKSALWRGALTVKAGASR